MFNEKFLDQILVYKGTMDSIKRIVKINIWRALKYGAGGELRK